MRDATGAIHRPHLLHAAFDKSSPHSQAGSASVRPRIGLRLTFVPRLPAVHANKWEEIERFVTPDIPRNLAVQTEVRSDEEASPRAPGVSVRVRRRLRWVQCRRQRGAMRRHPRRSNRRYVLFFGPSGRKRIAREAPDASHGPV